MRMEATVKKRNRKRLFIIITIAVASILALLIGELGASILCYKKFGSFSTSQAWEKEKNNNFLTAFNKEGKSYLETLLPHPYLGFVYRGDNVNNVGLFGRDVPFEKSPKEFLLMIAGSSVASQFAQQNTNGVKYLEDILNSRYDFGGRKVVVLNGGGGGWKYPQQAILFMMYANVLDAVITLDGFNEQYAFNGSSLRLEMPPNGFMEMNPLAKGSVDSFLGAYICNKIYFMTRDTPLLSHSHLYWLVSHMTRNIIERQVTKNDKGNKYSTQIQKLFELPASWDYEKIYNFNMGLYKDYIMAVDALAVRKGIKRAFFMQAVPALGKDLTPEELKNAGDLSYKKTYERMEKDLLSLNQQNIPVISLVDVFADCKETIYADHGHCKVYGPNSESKGYQIMAEKVAAYLEKLWVLKRKESSISTDSSGK